MKSNKLLKNLINFLKELLFRDSIFSILPDTNYQRHIPKNAKQLMDENWKRIFGGK